MAAQGYLPTNVIKDRIASRYRKLLVMNKKAPRFSLTSVLFLMTLIAMAFGFWRQQKLSTYIAEIEVANKRAARIENAYQLRTRVISLFDEANLETKKGRGQLRLAQQLIH